MRTISRWAAIILLVGKVICTDVKESALQLVAVSSCDGPSNIVAPEDQINAYWVLGSTEKVLVRVVGRNMQPDDDSMSIRSAYLVSESIIARVFEPDSLISENGGFELMHSSRNTRLIYHLGALAIGIPVAVPDGSGNHIVDYLVTAYLNPKSDHLLYNGPYRIVFAATKIKHHGIAHHGHPFFYKTDGCGYLLKELYIFFFRPEQRFDQNNLLLMKDSPYIMTTTSPADDASAYMLRDSPAKKTLHSRYQAGVIAFCRWYDGGRYMPWFIEHHMNLCSFIHRNKIQHLKNERQKMLEIVRSPSRVDQLKRDKLAVWTSQDIQFRRKQEVVNRKTLRPVVESEPRRQSIDDTGNDDSYDFEFLDDIVMPLPFAMAIAQRGGYFRRRSSRNSNNENSMADFTQYAVGLTALDRQQMSPEELDTECSICLDDILALRGVIMCAQCISVKDCDVDQKFGHYFHKTWVWILNTPSKSI